VSKKLKKLKSMWDIITEIEEAIEKHTRKIKKFEDSGNKAYLGETLNNYTIAYFTFRSDTDRDDIEILIDIDEEEFEEKWKEWRG
jgi:hypothetical protein